MHVRAGIGTDRLQPPGCTLDTVTERRHCLRALVAREQTNKPSELNKPSEQTPGSGGTAQLSPFELLQTNRRAARHHAERTLPCMPGY